MSLSEKETQISEKLNYVRPQQNWECGHTCGQQCGLGPTAKGTCQTTTACQPIKCEHRWVCNKSPLHGGKCEEGPSPNGECCIQQSQCVPRRSVRAQRKIMAVLSLVFTVGVLLSLFGASTWRTHLSPGPLTRPHAQLFLSEDGTENCSACHSLAGQGNSQWLAAFWLSNKEDGHALSQKCIDCHQQTISREFALNPHTASRSLLESKTEQSTVNVEDEPNTSALLNLVSFTRGKTEEIGCARCHQEHLGADHDLKVLADQQCNTCHAQQFKSLSHGHPEFKNWPVSRRSRIAFDHLSHSQKHFVDQKQIYDCKSCHWNSKTNEVVSVVDFEQACASCHNEQIKQSVATGIPLLSLPLIDPSLIEKDVVQNISWPQEATGDFDGRLPPLMQFLLRGDKRFEETVLFERDLDFALIDPDSPQDVQAATKTLPLITSLWAEISAQGQAEYVRRIEGIVGGKLSEPASRDLTSLLPTDLIRASYDRWLRTPLPVSSVSKKRSKSIQLVAGEKKPPRMFVAEEMIVFPGDELLINELPAGEWVGELGEAANSPTSPVVKTPNDVPVVKPNELKRQQQPLVKQNKIKPQTVTNNPKETMSPIAEAAPETVTVTPAPVKKNETEWKEIPQRGWYRNDLTLTVGYRPTGHADPFVKSWLDLAFSEASGPHKKAFINLRQHLRSSAAFGNCLSCHSVDQTQDGKYKVNWYSAPKGEKAKTFTFFSHRPHLTLPQLQDCSHCHQLDKQVDFAAAYKSNDPHSLNSNFEQLSKVSCIQCHNQQAAGASCLKCHNYHVDHLELNIPKPSLEIIKKRSNVLIKNVNSVGVKLE